MSFREIHPNDVYVKNANLSATEVVAFDAITLNGDRRTTWPTLTSDINIGALSANWQSTYITVSSLSGNWLTTKQKETVISGYNENVVDDYHSHHYNLDGRIGVNDHVVQLGGDPGGNRKQNSNNTTGVVVYPLIIQNDGKRVWLYNNIGSAFFELSAGETPQKYSRYFLDFDIPANSYKEGKIIDSTPQNSSRSLRVISWSNSTSEAVIASISGVNGEDEFYNPPIYSAARYSYLFPTNNSSKIEDWDFNKAIPLSSLVLDNYPPDAYQQLSWYVNVSPFKLNDGTWRILAARSVFSLSSVSLSTLAWYRQKRDFIQAQFPEYIKYYPLSAVFAYTPASPLPTTPITTTYITVLSAVEGSKPTIIFPRDQIYGYKLYDGTKDMVMETTEPETSGYRFCWDIEWDRPNYLNSNPWLNRDVGVKYAFQGIIGVMNAFYNPYSEDLISFNATRGLPNLYVTDISGSNLVRKAEMHYGAWHIPFSLIENGGTLSDANQIIDYLPSLTASYDGNTLYAAASGYYRSRFGWDDTVAPDEEGFDSGLGFGLLGHNVDNIQDHFGYTVDYNNDSLCIVEELVNSPYFRTRKMETNEITGSGIGSNSFLKNFLDPSYYTSYYTHVLIDKSGYGQSIYSPCELHKDKVTNDNYIIFVGASTKGGIVNESYTVRAKLSPSGDWTTKEYTNDTINLTNITAVPQDYWLNEVGHNVAVPIPYRYPKTVSVLSAASSADYGVSMYVAIPGEEISEGSFDTGTWYVCGIGVELPSWQNVSITDAFGYSSQTKNLSDYKFYGINGYGAPYGQEYDSAGIVTTTYTPTRLPWAWDRSQTLMTPPSNVFYYTVIDKELLNSTNTRQWRTGLGELCALSAFYGIPQIMKCVSSYAGITFDVLSGFMDLAYVVGTDYSMTDKTLFNHIYPYNKPIYLWTYMDPLATHNGDVYIEMPHVAFNAYYGGYYAAPNRTYVISPSTTDITDTSFVRSSGVEVYDLNVAYNPSLILRYFSKGYHPDFGYYASTGGNQFSLTQLRHTRPYGIPTNELSGYAISGAEENFFRKYGNYVESSAYYDSSHVRYDKYAPVMRYIELNRTLGAFEILVPNIEHITLGGKYYKLFPTEILTLSPSTTTYIYLEVDSYNSNYKTSLKLVTYEGTDPGNNHIIGPGARVRLGYVETDADGIVPGSVVSDTVDPYDKTIWSADDIENIGAFAATGNYLTLTINGSALYLPLYKKL